MYTIELVYKGEQSKHEVSLIQKVHFILSFAMYDTYTVYKDNQIVLQGKKNNIAC